MKKVNVVHLWEDKIWRFLIPKKLVCDAIWHFRGEWVKVKNKCTPSDFIRTIKMRCRIASKLGAFFFYIFPYVHILIIISCNFAIISIIFNCNCINDTTLYRTHFQLSFYLWQTAHLKHKKTYIIFDVNIVAILAVLLQLLFDVVNDTFFTSNELQCF